MDMKRKLIFVFFMLLAASRILAEDMNSRSPAVVGVVDVEGIRNTLAGLKIKEGVNTLEFVRKALERTGRVPANCVECDGAAKSKVTLLKDSEQKLEEIIFINSYDPAQSILKRDKNTPKKVKLVFRNPEGQSCYAGTNIFEINQKTNQVITGCGATQTHFVERVLEIDFSKLPVLKDNEEEFFELKIAKVDVREEPFTIEISQIGDHHLTVKVEKASLISSVDYRLLVSLQETKNE